MKDQLEETILKFIVDFIIINSVLSAFEFDRKSV
jgi:hypothetical protein